MDGEELLDIRGSEDTEDIFETALVENTVAT